MTTCKIDKLLQIGDLVVYMRCWREVGLRKYAVYRESDGRCLEEFRRKQSAIKWARESA